MSYLTSSYQACKASALSKREFHGTLPSFARSLYRRVFKEVRMRCGAVLHEGAYPNPTTNFLNMPPNDAELQRSDQPTHNLKVFADRGPGEGAFFKKPLPPGNLITFKSAYHTGMPTGLPGCLDRVLFRAVGAEFRCRAI